MCSLTSSVDRCEAARVIRCPIADLHSLPHTFYFIIPHRKGFGMICCRTRLGYRHRVSTFWSCSDGLIRKFLQWHHDSYGQVGTHNYCPQTSLPKRAQGHFSPLPEGSGQSQRGFRAALACHLLLVCKPYVLVWLSRGRSGRAHQPFFL